MARYGIHRPNTIHLQNYVQWLRNNDVCMNTVSCYLRSLRAIYNKVWKRYGLDHQRLADAN